MPLPQRKNVRLAPSNYTGDGYYFVTVCTLEHRCVFGTVIAGEMVLNMLGKQVAQAINDIPLHYPQTKLLASIVMPNHVHFILHLQNETHHLGQMVGAFKAPQGRLRRVAKKLLRAYNSVSTRI